MSKDLTTLSGLFMKLSIVSPERERELVRERERELERERESSPTKSLKNERKNVFIPLKTGKSEMDRVCMLTYKLLKYIHALDVLIWKGKIANKLNLSAILMAIFVILFFFCYFYKLIK